MHFTHNAAEMSVHINRETRHFDSVSHSGELECEPRLLFLSMQQFFVIAKAEQGSSSCDRHGSIMDIDRLIQHQIVTCHVFEVGIDHAVLVPAIGSRYNRSYNCQATAEEFTSLHF